MGAVGLVVALAFVLAGCGGPSAAPSVEQTSAERACAGTTFGHCIEDVGFAEDLYPAGKQIAICDADNGKGSVVAVADGGSGDQACTEDALDPGRLVRVVTVP
jgi:hypothetical protein